MSKKIISKIEDEIVASAGLSVTRKSELMSLMGDLKKELANIEQHNFDKAVNIANLTGDSATKALKPATVNSSDTPFSELKNSVSEFEVTHPELVRIVNQICIMLSNIGI